MDQRFQFSLPALLAATSLVGVGFAALGWIDLIHTQDSIIPPLFLVAAGASFGCALAVLMDPMMARKGTRVAFLSVCIITATIVCFAGGAWFVMWLNV